MHSTATTTVTSIGANMYSDAAATHEIAQGAVVPERPADMAQINWSVRRASSTATAVATVPSGNVYLYDRWRHLGPKADTVQNGHPESIVTATGEFRRARVIGGAKSDHWTASRAPGRRYDPLGLQWHCPDT